VVILASAAVILLPGLDLIGIMLLSQVVKTETERYFQR
jgi:Na+/alanine symporter